MYLNYSCPFYSCSFAFFIILSMYNTFICSNLYYEYKLVCIELIRPYLLNYIPNYNVNCFVVSVKIFLLYLNS
jgi:hypothetical protein